MFADKPYATAAGRDIKQSKQNGHTRRVTEIGRFPPPKKNVFRGRPICYY